VRAGVDALPQNVDSEVTMIVISLGVFNKISDVAKMKGIDTVDACEEALREYILRNGG
jgi:hypothetical protein